MDEGSTVHRERMTRLDQEEHHSRHVVGTAKLVTPFSAGIAAAFVTAGGFEGEPQWWHYLALGLMLATIGLTVWVVSTKRKGKLEFDDIELPQDRLYPRYKRVAAANRDHADTVHTLMVAQIVLSTATVLVVVLPFLIGCAPQ
jgi:hypothetical protein